MRRNTRQREAIRAAIESAGRPLAPREVLESAGRSIPGLGLATVYRNLKELTASGWLVRVEVAGEAARYERAGMDHHHHYHCCGCDRVFDVPGCPAGRVGELVPDGFSVETHELVLHGRCADCGS